MFIYHVLFQVIEWVSIIQDRKFIPIQLECLIQVRNYMYIKHYLHVQLISKGIHCLLPRKSYWKFSGGRYLMEMRFMLSLPIEGL